MTVIDNKDGTFNVVTTPEERAAFDQAVAAGLIDGGTPAAALELYLRTAFSTLVSTARKDMIKKINETLPGLTAAKLQAVLQDVKA